MFPWAVSQTDITPKRHIQLLLSEPLITYPPKFSLTPAYALIQALSPSITGLYRGQVKFRPKVIGSGFRVQRSGLKAPPTAAMEGILSSSYLKSLFNLLAISSIPDVYIHSVLPVKSHMFLFRINDAKRCQAGYYDAVYSLCIK